MRGDGLFGSKRAHEFSLLAPAFASPLLARRLSTCALRPEGETSPVVLLPSAATLSETGVGAAFSVGAPLWMVSMRSPKSCPLGLAPSTNFSLRDALS